MKSLALLTDYWNWNLQMIDPECTAVVTVTQVKVEEKNRKAVFLNQEHIAHTKIRMDGCVVRNATAADWVVTKEGVGTVIVELKGKDVEHGARQVTATAQYLKDQNYAMPKVAALIVASSYPKASPTIQKSQSKFFRQFKGPLHVVTRNETFTFERVLSAAGPK